MLLHRSHWQARSYGKYRGPAHSDTDSTAVGDPEVVSSPPADALQEPCSIADPQRSDARPEEQPLSSSISDRSDGMAFSGNASGVMAYQK